MRGTEREVLVKWTQVISAKYGAKFSAERMEGGAAMGGLKRGKNHSVSGLVFFTLLLIAQETIQPVLLFSCLLLLLDLSLDSGTPKQPVLPEGPTSPGFLDITLS